MGRDNLQRFNNLLRRRGEHDFNLIVSAEVIYHN